MSNASHRPIPTSSPPPAPRHPRPTPTHHRHTRLGDNATVATKAPAGTGAPLPLAWALAPYSTRQREAPVARPGNVITRPDATELARDPRPVVVVVHRGRERRLVLVVHRVDKYPISVFNLSSSNHFSYSHLQLLTFPTKHVRLCSIFQINNQNTLLLRMTDPDVFSIRSDASVKSVNMYGSPVPDNVDGWRYMLYC